MEFQGFTTINQSLGKLCLEIMKDAEYGTIDVVKTIGSGFLFGVSGWYVHLD